MNLEICILGIMRLHMRWNNTTSSSFTSKTINFILLLSLSLLLHFAEDDRQFTSLNARTQALAIHLISVLLLSMQRNKKINAHELIQQHQPNDTKIIDNNEEKNFQVIHFIWSSKQIVNIFRLNENSSTNKLRKTERDRAREKKTTIIFTLEFRSKISSWGVWRICKFRMSNESRKWRKFIN